MSIRLGETLISGVQDISGKANVSLDNLNSDGKSYGSKLGMPSGNFISLTLGASGTNYTAPANGYFCLSKQASGSLQWANLINNGGAIRMVASAPSGIYIYVYIPVKKGDNVIPFYDATGSTEFFRFVYAEGDKT